MARTLARRASADDLLIERSLSIRSHPIFNTRVVCESRRKEIANSRSTDIVNPGCGKARSHSGAKRLNKRGGTLQSTMPVTSQQGGSCAVSMPFRSPFGEDINRTTILEESTGQNAPVKDVMTQKTAAENVSGHNFTSYHQHRDSTSTSASESTDSSPTTTISTVDSVSMTEPSPGPSPESPANPNLPSFSNNLRQRKMDSVQNHFFELQRPTTPAKKPRNLKGLAVNTSQASANLGRAISTAQPSFATSATAEHTTSAPASPSFIKPMSPPKKKQPTLNLSIQTPANSHFPSKLSIPATPGFAQRPNMLRHFQSSPSLPHVSLVTSPDGSKKRPALVSSRTTGFAEVPMEEEEEEPNFDVPQSREEKPESYPNGPICIYESGVYLYFEPTADQASSYDVIFNVASEVKNPFDAQDSDRSSPDPLKEPTNDGIDFGAVQILGTDSTDINMMSPESRRDSSPTTPKATPLADRPTSSKSAPATMGPRPEYIHIPWEHNTDIVPDLYKLVKTIEDRVQQGKRVLVHCQCGVSRSASLIVAYGLYKNPGISVQEAYDAVKKRSKWIGPNMNLIMQLQEFRSGLVRQQQQPSNSMLRTPGYARKLTPNVTSATSDPRSSTFAPPQYSASEARTPRTAPLPPDTGFGPSPSPQRASTGNIAPPSPAPMSAPLPGSPSFRSSWDVGQKPPVDLVANAPTLAPPAPMALTTDSPHVVTQNPELPSINVSRHRTTSASSQDSSDAKRDTIPNFSRLSRQVPSQTDSDGDSQMTDAFEITSPVKTTFDIPSFPSHPSEPSSNLMSPMKAEFSDPPTPPPRNPARTNGLHTIRPHGGAGISDQNGFTHLPNLTSPTASGFPAGVMGQAVKPPSPPRSGFNRPLPLRDIPAPTPLQHRQPASLGSILHDAIGSKPAAINTKSTDAVLTSKESSQRSPPSVMGSPPRQRLRTKYSMPDMQTQRRLQQLQANIESKLPNKSPEMVDRAQDDIDALTSPRATEFTKNPFHDWPTAPKDGAQGLGFNFDFVPISEDGRKTPTPDDPRSPVNAAGANPITRNIFGVL